MASTRDIVQKLWNLCHVLRDDGVTYLQYVTELTFLLFLKMAQETGQESELPKGCRWADLVKRDNAEQLDFYRGLLLQLGKAGSSRVQLIFANATTTLRQPRNLRTLVENIDGLDWYSAKEEGLGDMYEGLLEKNAEETKSGAGQYFTPRPLIDCMVDRIQPQPGEAVQDPATGTGGFLVAASRYVRARTDELHDLEPKQQTFQIKRAFQGVELVPDVQRLALMNGLLHGFEPEIRLGDALGPTGASLPKVDIILTNPPFGTKKGGGAPTRDDITYPTSNKQLVFLQHIYRGLKPGGRAAVVLPDNVLFEDGVGQKVRTDLMDKCDLHTILRLPTGIFYAQGVKTNVLFFTRGATDKGNTKAVWFYDLRTNAPSFGKRTPLTRAHFAPFDKAYGDDPHGKAKRKDQGAEGKFRKFARDEIGKRGDNLDITWLRDDSVANHDDLREPEVIAAEIVAQLEIALEEMRGLQQELGGVSELPDGWRLGTVGEVIDGFEAGRNLKAHGRPAGDGEYGVLKISAVSWGTFNPAENKALLPGDMPRPRELVVAGDVLISRANTTELVGAAVRVAATPPKLMLPDKILRLRYRADQVDPDYLVQALRTPLARTHLEKEATGTSDSMRNLAQPKIEATPLILPPLGEQRRIVAKLETLQARGRRARQALDAIPPLLEKLRQSILAAAFRGDLTKAWRAQNPAVEPASELLKRIRVERRAKWEEAELAKMIAKGKAPKDDRWKAKYEEPKPVDASGLPELPAGWCWAGLSELAFLQLGQRRAPEFAKEAEYPYVRAANITWRGLDLTDLKSMGFADPEAHFLQEGDVLLNEASGSPREVGKPALWRGEIDKCCFQATVLRLRPCSPLAPGEWLQRCFLADALLGRFAAMAPGVGMVHLTAERMRAWPIPLPPSDEQRIILNRVLTQLERVDTAVQQHEALALGLRALERTTLAKAFRGELVAHDDSIDAVNRPIDAGMPTPGAMPDTGTTPAKRGRRKAS